MRLDYSPTTIQAPIHRARDGGCKVIAAEVGRRGGKTRAGIADLLDCYTTARAIKRGPETGLYPPFHAWLVVPDFPQARQPWNEMKSLIPPEYIVRIDNNDWMLWLKGGPNWGGRNGLLEVKSAYYHEKLQTVGLDYLWISEAQDVPNEAFEKVAPTTRSPGRLGWRYYEGIPALYPEHWYWRACDLAKRQKAQFYHHATTFENPLLTGEDKEDIVSDKDIISPGAWERMYLAKRSTSAGFFRGIDECVGGDLADNPVPGQEYIGGFDAGWTTDPSVFVIMDASERRVMNTWEYGANFSMRDTTANLEVLSRHWGLSRLVFDASSSGGKAYEEAFGDSDVLSPIAEPFAIVGERRKELLNRLSGGIDRMTVSFPRIPMLIRQLRAMQERVLKNGQWSTAVPQGEHDDYIFAFALALTACHDPSQSVPKGDTHRPKWDSVAVPTIEELMGHGMSRALGAKLMRERRQARTRARHEVAGIPEK